jgi:type 1 fimbria pilin
MKGKKTVSTFFSIAFIGAFMLSGTAASAQGSALMFHGQLVNAGCEAKVLTMPGQLHGLKSLKVNASLTLGLVDHDDACEGVAVPVSLAYAERTSVPVGAHSGIVTLTYQ